MASKIWATVSDQLSEKIERRADDEGRSKSDLISYLLERSMEGWQGRQEVLEAMEKIKEAIKKEDLSGALAVLETIEEELRE